MTLAGLFKQPHPSAGLIRGTNWPGLQQLVSLALRQHRSIAALPWRWGASLPSCPPWAGRRRQGRFSTLSKGLGRGDEEGRSHLAILRRRTDVEEAKEAAAVVSGYVQQPWRLAAPAYWLAYSAPPLASLGTATDAVPVPAPPGPTLPTSHTSRTSRSFFFLTSFAYVKGLIRDASVLSLKRGRSLVFSHRILQTDFRPPSAMGPIQKGLVFY